MSIYIFSRPVHSGKTTELMQWCDQQKNIAGVLMPDINGSRKILDLKTKTVFDIECTDAANSNELITTIGRFNFYTAAFGKANSILLNAMAKEPGWLLIDEAGKLELDGKGFYESIVYAIELYDNNGPAANLVITVRDSLCEEVISFFNIKNYKIIRQLNELA